MEDFHLARNAQQALSSDFCNIFAKSFSRTTITVSCLTKNVCLQSKVETRRRWKNRSGLDCFPPLFAACSSLYTLHCPKGSPAKKYSQILHSCSRMKNTLQKFSSKLLFLAVSLLVSGGFVGCVLHSCTDVDWSRSHKMTHFALNIPCFFVKEGNCSADSTQTWVSPALALGLRLGLLYLSTSLTATFLCDALCKR